MDADITLDDLLDELADRIAAKVTVAVEDAATRAAEQAQAPADRLLRMEEVASRLGLAEDTLRWQRQNGRFPTELRIVNVSSGSDEGDEKKALRPRVRESDLEKYFASRQVKS